MHHIPTILRDLAAPSIVRLVVALHAHVRHVDFRVIVTQERGQQVQALEPLLHQQKSAFLCMLGQRVVLRGLLFTLQQLLLDGHSVGLAQRANLDI